ncbi:MAG: fliO [Hydrocarboniphaga sp.]|nr:fliO [Hydrocarboniphaga sp.]
MQSLLSLMLVIGAIFLLAWILRRVQNLRPKGTGALRVHSGLSVGNRERVLWIEAGGQHLLIGVAPGRINTLHVFDSAPESADIAPASGPAAPNFGELLKKALGREAQ